METQLRSQLTQDTVIYNSFQCVGRASRNLYVDGYDYEPNELEFNERMQINLISVI